MDGVSSESKDLLRKMALRRMLAQDLGRRDAACDSGAYTAREEERLAALRWTIACGQGWIALEDSARSRLDEAVVARLAVCAYGELGSLTEEVTTDLGTHVARTRPVLPDDLVTGATVCSGFGGGLGCKIAASLSLLGGRGEGDREEFVRKVIQARCAVGTPSMLDYVGHHFDYDFLRLDLADPP